MAEEVKKKTTTKKNTSPKPKAAPKPKVEKPKEPETVPEEPKPVEEEPKVLDIPVLEEPKAFDVETFEPKEEVPAVEEPKPVEFPKEVETFEEFHKAFENSPVEIKKLNPNLPDNKSKWISYIPTKTGRHILFKGSYARAYRAAENWNKARGLSKSVKEIRSK